MLSLLLRLVINAAALWVADRLLDGITADDTTTLLVTAAVFGVVNAFVKPLVLLLSLPLILLTLGLFLFVINALMLLLAGEVVPGFEVDGFGTAFVGALIVSLVSWALSALLPDA